MRKFMQKLGLVPAQSKPSTINIFLSLLRNRLYGMIFMEDLKSSSLKMTGERSRLTSWSGVLSFSLRSRGSCGFGFYSCTNVLLSSLYLQSSLSLHHLGEAAYSGTCYVAALMSKHTGF